MPMAISKVTLNGETLMDVTQDTVAINNLLTGETATGADGEPVAGGLTIPTFTTQEKSVSPTESEQVVQPDSGKDGLSKVTVGAISKTYVGSDITRRDSTSLSASGATVTVPAGYYSSQASKLVSTTTHPKPTVSLNSTTGVVTASHVQTTGYVTGGTTTETLELTTKAAATITPSETQQEIASGQYLTGKQTIAAIPSTYVGSGITKDPTPTASGKTVTIPAGYYSEQTTKDVATVTQATPSVSVNSSGLITATATQSAGYVSAGTKSGTKQLTTKSAATITPGTTDQTIAASTYLTGVQTIKGDANLVSENIAEGKSIFGVAGSFVGGVPITLEVNVDTGSAVTVTNGTTTLTGTSENGKCTFMLPEAGTWTASATKSGQTSGTKTVSVVDTYAVTLSFVSSTLNDNEWSVIRAVSDAGKGANYWSIGDRKAVTLNGTVGSCTFSNKVVYAFIIGFNHNASREGDNRIHFQFGKTALSGGTDICFIDSSYNKSGSSAAFRMNTSNTNSDGWNKSYMRKTICGASLSSYSGTFIAALPSDLRSVLKTVTKYTDNMNNDSAEHQITPTTDVIFLLSEYEVYGVITYANSDERSYQSQYAYYSAGNSKVKYKHSSTGTDASWWLRSPLSTSVNNFLIAHTNGKASGFVANYSLGFAPAFCV